MAKKFTEFDRNSIDHDAWAEGDGTAHAWTYRREITSYICVNCRLVISKTDLKKFTDAVDVAPR